MEMFTLNYSPVSREDFLLTITNKLGWCSLNKTQFSKAVCAFDIETTSLYKDSENKAATMYCWQFGINGVVTMGRTWEEFLTLLNEISKRLELSEKRRLIIFVHNLSFEFQFIRKLFKWLKVFASEQRKPYYAICEQGFEFRDSLILSGYALEKLGDELTQYDVHKMVGDLDYGLLRGKTTPLTMEEIGYCVNDVLVVMAWIDEQIGKFGSITKLPLTKTGIVRRECRKRCLKMKGHKRNLDYMRMISNLIINDVEELDMLHRAFTGGFTHANPSHSRMLLHNVSSYDFTSSYPTVMVSEKFPMSRGRKVTPKNIDEFYKILNNYCCIFDIEIFGLRPRVLFDNILSYSRCYDVKDAELNNGRIFKCSHLFTTLTNVDFFNLMKFYTCEQFKVTTVTVYKSDYLPKEIITMILDLYENKTKLKGVDGMEVEYMQSKAMLNSMYGMCVTDIMHNEIEYIDDIWTTNVNTPDEKAELLYKYNHNPQRFLFYPWGVFVTAYARNNLYSGLLEFAQDYVYSDTDSIKCLNREKHLDYINTYNKNIIKKCGDCLKFYGIDEKRASPKTIEGVEKPLGVWDYEGTYDYFKTIGAKRYMTVKNNEVSLTVAGLGKKANKYFSIEKYGNIEKAFEKFDIGCIVPPAHTGKLLHSYIDDIRKGDFTDYLGNKQEYMEASGTCLEPEAFAILDCMGYLNFLKGYMN